MSAQAGLRTYGSAQRPRILALHGFRTSADILKSQVLMASLQPSFDRFEVAYLNGRHAASGPVFQEVKSTFQGPFFEWWDAQPDSSGNRVYQGLPETLEYVSRYLKDEGPFAGVMGFSQGASLCAIVLAMQQSGQYFQDVPDLRFCVLISAGGKCRDKRYSELLDTPIQCPSLHLLGKRDPLLQSAEQLASCFASPQLLYHTAGHVVPRLKDQDLDNLDEWLEQQLKAVSILC